MNSGRRFASIYRRPSRSQRAADLEQMTANGLRASSGLGLPRASYLLGMAAPPPVGAASRNGRNRGCSWSYGGRFWPSSMTKRRSALVSVSPMAASPRPKRGAQGEPDQEGGREVDGPGAGTALWSIPGLGIPGGGEAVGEDSRHGGGKASGQARTAPQAASAGDCRSRFRQQPLAQARGNRADHPGAQEPSRGTDQDGRELRRYRRH